MFKTSSRGFTLIELLVVIAIIGLLGSIALAAFGGARRKGRDARRLEDIQQLRVAIDLYSLHHASQRFPGINGWDDTSDGSWGGLAAALAPTYIPALPRDPTNNATYYYGYRSTNGAAPAPVVCNTAGGCGGYVLRARLEAAAVTSGFTTTVEGVSCTPGAAAPFNYCITQ